MLVITDLDDTLCNTWEAGKKTLLEALLFLFRKRKFRAIAYFLLKKYRRFESSEKAHLMDLDELVETVFRDVYPDASDEEIREVVSFVERAFFSHLHLFLDAVPFLSGLKKLGAKIVLLTDSSTEWQRKKLEVLGISEYFDGIIISGETGHSKLEDYNFRLALQKFPSSEVYVVGDRDETDMRGGRAIGATTILVRRGYFKSRKVRFADYVVNNLLEALEVINREHKKRAEA
ncbi:HAD family hydrolase [Thermococcus stetteri]|uniref:HAD family hydrolase n=1 Tax=Thermococcus stetteri TaxID=49900 RepID=UPI001AE74E4A|nr:HAD family hydrolase [Thermococcus stetteri]MBP1911571.1 putative hydrolase of the HAD superfamily [Thermococcus stetteri]